MYQNSKNVHYRFSKGDKLYVVNDNHTITELVVIKKLRKPHRLSDNFYLCEWDVCGRRKQGVKYEKELFRDYSKALKNLLLCREKEEEKSRK